MIRDVQAQLDADHAVAIERDRIITFLHTRACDYLEFADMKILSDAAWAIERGQHWKDGNGTKIETPPASR